MTNATAAEIVTLVVRDSTGQFCEAPVSAFSAYRVTPERQAELERENAASQGSDADVSGCSAQFPAFNPAQTYGCIPLQSNGALPGLAHTAQSELRDPHRSAGAVQPVSPLTCSRSHLVARGGRTTVIWFD